MPRRIYKAYNSQELTFSTTISTFRLCGIARRCRTLWTFVKCYISIAYFDCNSPSQLFAMSTCPYTCNSFNEGSFAVIYVSRSAYVNTGLISKLLDVFISDVSFQCTTDNNLVRDIKVIVCRPLYRY